MATMKENITNALSWFYDKLKKNDLDPIQEEIDELNTNITQVNTNLNNKSNILSTQSFDSTTFTLTASESTTVNISVSRSGYTPLAIADFRIINSDSGAGSSWCNIYRLSRSSSTVTVGVINMAASLTVTDVMARITVLYVAN